MNIQLAIEGEGAVEATESLLAIPGIEGSFAPVEEGATRETMLATIATIIGIVGGAIAIAEQIRQWYQEYRSGQAGKKLDKVVIITPRGRILLEQATTEEIAQALAFLTEEQSR